MSYYNPAEIGMPLADVDTPALILELDAFEHNLKRLQDSLAGRNVKVRPHAKSNKCPEIALRQMALGAVGVCCQKVSEAAVFVAAGIPDVLVTNEVVGEAKIRHLFELARQARLGVLVDDPLQIQALAVAAKTHKVSLDVYIEVNVGANRCGVEPGDPAVPLALQIAASAPLRFAGLQCYHGTAQHLRSPQERANAIRGAADAARKTVAAIQAAGLAVERVTGAGTGTFVHERNSGIFNEVQAGSYIFMDRDYGDNQRGEGDIVFEHALFVRTTVMSRPTADRAVVDAGLKASSVDSGMPTVWQRPDLRYAKAADEHGALVTPNQAALALGDSLWLVPGHCDPTVNLYDELICFRGDRVEAVWPIAARGALL